MEPKEDIRRRLLEWRTELAPSVASAMSVSIRDRLWALPEFNGNGRVLTYFSAKDNEADTLAIIGRLLDEGRQVACPAVAPAKSLVWRKVESLHGMAPGKFGIPVPDEKRCEVVEPDATSIVLVPGIAFSRDGHRIGYGGGYFDRFLAAFPGTSIGLAYDFQIVDALPHEAHDERVDIVVTDKHVYRAGAT